MRRELVWRNIDPRASPFEVSLPPFQPTPDLGLQALLGFLVTSQLPRLRRVVPTTFDRSLTILTRPMTRRSAKDLACRAPPPALIVGPSAISNHRAKPLESLLAAWPTPPTYSHLRPSRVQSGTRPLLGTSTEPGSFFHISRFGAKKNVKARESHELTLDHTLEEVVESPHGSVEPKTASSSSILACSHVFTFFSFPVPAPFYRFRQISCLFILRREGYMRPEAGQVASRPFLRGSVRGSLTYLGSSVGLPFLIEIHFSDFWARYETARVGMHEFFLNHFQEERQVSCLFRGPRDPDGSKGSVDTSY
ncbi:hypothetical protein CRG98_013750 [Punica granatum]|uniref:Uncharacterized protein n=1 Tax=Punica granatum TaxID=22663 RepID=A0A2I0KDL3_PUNGR|nr:hypothetical protein CRG98_013750 [Punica granatum]